MNGGEQRCACNAQEKTIINQIMLRFRPIAPKPVISDGTVADKSVPEKVNKKRVKRKYVRVKKRKSSRLVRDNSGGEWINRAVEMIGDEVGTGIDFRVTGAEKKVPCCVDFRRAEDAVGLMRKDEEALDLLHDSNRTAAVIWPAAKDVVESWITMESVTDMCGDGSRLGCTDEERMRYLDGDTCPGFISNSLDQVEWVNPAYRKMMDPAGGPSSEFVVSLVVKEKFLLQWPAFSCRVRLVNNYCKERKSVQMMIPCDVWKMDFGGFAWRLDLESALSLGR